MVNFVNDVRIIGIITLVALLAITVVGMEWEARVSIVDQMHLRFLRYLSLFQTQLVLLAIIIASLVNFFVGSWIPPSNLKKAMGIFGYSADTFSDNFWPAFRDGHSFMTIFAIFFPACTGIMAGANISGDLKVLQILKTQKR